MRSGAGLLTLALLGGCSGSGSGADATAGAKDFVRCVGRSFTPAAEEDFRHTTNSILALTDPIHAAEDVIVEPGASAELRARFAYGPLVTDLDDEDVRVFIDDCKGWRSLGDETTDDSGRVEVRAPDGLRAGVYEVRFQVLGDQSVVGAYLWVLTEGTRLVVTDIDGTLTASDSELFLQILDGSHVPEAYPGAIELTQAHAEQGYVVVYLTGRPYALTGHTRDWTNDLDFALGPLHVTSSNDEALPGEDGVGAYKLAWLEGLIEQGYVIDYAYGNASTDLYAYLGAGLDPSTVWIIGTHAGEQETNGVTDSWEERVDEVRALEPVAQPFGVP